MDTARQVCRRTEKLGANPTHCEVDDKLGDTALPSARFLTHSAHSSSIGGVVFANGSGIGFGQGTRAWGWMRRGVGVGEAWTNARVRTGLGRQKGADGNGTRMNTQPSQVRAQHSPLSHGYSRLLFLTYLWTGVAPFSFPTHIPLS